MLVVVVLCPELKRQPNRNQGMGDTGTRGRGDTFCLLPFASCLLLQPVTHQDKRRPKVGVLKFFSELPF